MARFRIGYFGDGPWASLALERISASRPDVEVVFVTPRSDTRDPDLQRLAGEIGCPFRIFENINANDVVADLHAMDLDLIVSMSFNQIMKKDFLGAARHGVINCHAGALPRYRGRNVLNWALINGETEFGVTVHFVDEGIDTGDIILQAMVPIAPSDCYAELLDKAYGACADTLIAAIDQIARGTATRTPQPATGGFYCGRRRPGDEWIDWTWPSERIHNLVRGISDPGPGARFSIGETVYAVHRSVLVPDAPAYIGTPGEVVGRTGDGVLVKTGSSVIGLARCVDTTEDTEQFTPRWPIGTRLLGAVEYRLARLEAAADMGTAWHA